MTELAWAVSTTSPKKIDTIIPRNILIAVAKKFHHTSIVAYTDSVSSGYAVFVVVMPNVID